MKQEEYNRASAAAQELAKSLAKKRTGIRVVARYRLKQFGVWAGVCGWNGIPKRRHSRWDILQFLGDHAALAVSGDTDASVRRQCLKWAPKKLSDAELDELVAGARDARLWRSDDCARLLGISAADREKYGLTHLGAKDDRTASSGKLMPRHAGKNETASGRRRRGGPRV